MQFVIWKLPNGGNQSYTTKKKRKYIKLSILFYKVWKVTVLLRRDKSERNPSAGFIEGQTGPHFTALVP